MRDGDAGLGLVPGVVAVRAGVAEVDLDFLVVGFVEDVVDANPALWGVSCFANMRMTLLR